jgi:hypothetical protein
MPSGATYLQSLNRYCILLLGEVDTGKSRQALSFPDPYIACFDPAGIAIAKSDAKLRANLERGWVEYLVPTKESLPAFFAQSQAAKLKANENIYALRDDVVRKANSGAIQTFIFDGFTFFADAYMAKVTEFDQAKFKTDSGGTNTQGMYGDLGNYLAQFVIGTLMPLTQAGPHGLNVIVTCHLMRESEEKLEGNARVAKPLAKGADIKPSVLGNYRNKIDGPFGAAYVFETDLRTVKLKKREGEEKQREEERMKYWCYVRKCAVDAGNTSRAGFGKATIKAKDKYGLSAIAPRWDLTNKYLFDVLQEVAARGVTDASPEASTTLAAPAATIPDPVADATSAT